MFGKMSVGAGRITNGLNTKMSSAKTTKVYGRVRASLTIHIEHLGSQALSKENDAEHTGISPLLTVLSSASLEKPRSSVRSRKPRPAGAPIYLPSFAVFSSSG